MKKEFFKITVDEDNKRVWIEDLNPTISSDGTIENIKQPSLNWLKKNFPEEFKKFGKKEANYGINDDNAAEYCLYWEI